MNKKQNGDLNAVSDAYVPKIYREKLDQVLADIDIKNVAITAPYDSGKTTILKSYFKQRENKYKWYIRLNNSLVDRVNRIKKYFFFRPNLLTKIHDYEFINIPNFFDLPNYESMNNDDEIKNFENKKTSKQRSSIAIKLEKSIIEQLLFKPESNKYPDSNLKRLKIHSSFSIFLDLICIIFILMYLVRIFTNIKGLQWLNSLSFWNERKFQFISFLIVIIGVGKFFNSLVHTISKVNLHASTKFGPFKVAGKAKGKQDYQIDLFNYYGDELQYYFARNDIRVVIFEDLDRFNSPIIFQKLRELNSNLNKSGNKITFIYSLKDKVFSVDNNEVSSAALKTKFFDAIIPIFPIHSYRNSRKVFVKERNKYRLLDSDFKDQTTKYEDDYFKNRDKELKEKERQSFNIDEKYLAALGLYISDTREIKNIISETNFYVTELPLETLKRKNAVNKVFAVIIYKNEFPKDFDNLASGKESNFEDFINGINDLRLILLREKIANNEQKIHNLDAKINKLHEELTEDLETLMRIRLQQLANESSMQSVKIDNIIYTAADNIEKIYDFWKKTIDNNFKYQNRFSQWKNVNNLDKTEQVLFKDYLLNNKIDNKVLDQWQNLKYELQEENRKIRTQFLHLEISKLFELFLRNKDLIKGKLNNEKIGKGIEFIDNNPVLKYLVQQGLLDFDFSDYISPDPYTLIGKDKEFVRMVINHTDVNDEDYHLIKPKLVIEELDSLDNSVNTFSYAFSPDVLVNLANDKSRPLEYVNSLIVRAKNNNFCKFVLISLETPDLNLEGAKRILKGITNEWPEYYSLIFKQDNVNDDLKLELADQLLFCLSRNIYSELPIELEKQRIWENNIFEKQFILLSSNE